MFRLTRRAALQIVTAMYGGSAVYIVVGGALGFLLPQHNAPFHMFHYEEDPPYCFPELDLLGFITTRCSSDFLNALWLLLVGLPRALLMLPSWTILLMIDHMRGRGRNGAEDLLKLGLSTLVLLSLFTGAVLCWCRRFPRFGITLVAFGMFEVGLFVHQIMALARK